MGQKRPHFGCAHFGVPPRACFRKVPQATLYELGDRSKELIGTTDNFVREVLLKRETHLECGAFTFDAGNGNGSAVVAYDLL